MSYRDLPYDAEIEYLENDGSSSIDTMYHIASYNVSLEIKYMQTANTTAIGFLFYQFNGSNQYVAIYSNASNKLSAVWGNNWKASTTSSDRNIHILKLENKTLYRDGTSLFTTDNPAAFTSSDNNVHIFNLGLVILARVYWAKIHYNNELVRDLIPVRVGQVGYMYDKVSRQLFGNSGTGSFILGPDVAPGRYANEVAFLESWGNQYIDTGIKPSTDTKIELKCLYCKSGVGFTNYGALIGADDSTNAYTLTHSDMANFTFGTSVSKDFANPQTKLLTFDSTASSNSMSVYDEGGTLVTTLSCIRGIFEVNQNLYLFAINRNGTPVYGSNRIMYCKIYDGDALVRDYVPVEYNGIGYMYDKVSGLFFDNKGTGKFLFGSIAKACARSYTRRQLMMEMGRSYDAEIEYLQSDGNAYIDTGIIGSQNTDYEVKTMFTKNRSYPYIFGAQQADRQRRFSLMEGSYNSFYYTVNDGTLEKNSSLSSAEQSGINIIKKVGRNVYVNNTLKITFVDTNYTTPVTITLYAGNQTSGIKTSNRFTNGKIYYIKFYESNVLVRDFIPVRVGNVGYMYDRVSGQLFGNSGTGSFILGPDKN